MYSGSIYCDDVNKKSEATGQKCFLILFVVGLTKNSINTRKGKDHPTLPLTCAWCRACVQCALRSATNFNNFNKHCSNTTKCFGRVPGRVNSR